MVLYHFVYLSSLRVSLLVYCFTCILHAISCTPYCISINKTSCSAASMQSLLTSVVHLTLYGTFISDVRGKLPVRHNVQPKLSLVVYDIHLQPKIDLFAMCWFLDIETLAAHVRSHTVMAPQFIFKLESAQVPFEEILFSSSSQYNSLFACGLG